jgi:signal peptidase I
VREGRRIARRQAHRLTSRQGELVRERTAAVAAGLRGERALEPAAASLAGLLDGELAFARKSTARQYIESIGSVVFVALLLRSFVVEAYQIPSGSMIPTLQVGDHIWVNKLVYGLRIPFTDIKLGTHYRPPHRGEIIVFSHPKKPEEDLIKRVIAVAGDTVEMRGDVVYVNGRPDARVHQGIEHYFDVDESSGQWMGRDADAWQESSGKAQFTTLFDPALEPRDFGPVRVPADALFVMGDNRDNSSDSRYWGFVPLNLVRGRAMVVWLSWGQPDGIRYRRIGHLLR